MNSSTSPTEKSSKLFGQPTIARCRVERLRASSKLETLLPDQIGRRNTEREKRGSEAEFKNGSFQANGGLDT